MRYYFQELRVYDLKNYVFLEFMQEPLFESAAADIMGPNAAIFTNIVIQHASNISAVGSAPYVERTRTQQLANIRFILDLAIQHNLHADFHLDYDLRPLFSSSSASSQVTLNFPPRSFSPSIGASRLLC